MDAFHNALRWVVGGAAGVVLVVLLTSAVASHFRPEGEATRGAHRVLRPGVGALVGVVFSAVCVVLWRPLPIEPGAVVRTVADLAGAVLAVCGLGFVIWGRISLGRLYGVSSAWGAKLHADHHLVTSGAFSHVRHPMYLGIELASLGGLLLYRTWTMVFLVVVFLGLVLRARQEDRLLRAVFGEQWEAYQREVAAWMPRLGSRWPHQTRDARPRTPTRRHVRGARR